MSDSSDGKTPIEDYSASSEPLPPLGIRHLLMFTTGIAVALAMVSAFLSDQQSGNSEVSDSLFGLLFSIPIGSGAAFLSWIACRAYLRKLLPVRDPGAKFAVVQSVAAIVTCILEGVLLVLVRTDRFPIHLLLVTVPVLLCYLASFYWITEDAWRITLVFQMLAAVTCLFPFSLLIGGAALLYAFQQDIRENRSHHWTHYFGMILWLFSQIPIV